LKEMLVASLFVIKYAGIIVLSDLDQHSLLPLLVHRLNIYTNPQVPLSVEERIYEIGKPNEESPVLLSSNWALTYLILSSAIEATNIPTFLCVKSVGEEADVLCWCHHCLRSVQLGKLSGDATGQFIKKCGIEDRVKHRRMVIPGRAARFKAELEQALPDWEIIAGPEEAARIVGFLPEFAEKLKKLSGNLDFGSEGDLNSKGSG
jgi:acetyl-CoA decarbonylase/synthase complex subunit gamma